ncbi:dnaJ homolog subfamily C member 24-like [Centruroides sculpturatus]|nr:dnaJ homolog subfamily C member 24-like [Centruroides sculpturatus]
MEDGEFVDFYAILGLTKNATKEELKKQYHSLILKHHPDKTKVEDSVSHFCKIDEAWKTLSNDQLKNEYDAKLKAWELKNTHAVHEEVKISSMNKISDESYERSCRCGGSYILDPEDLKYGSCLVIECDSCSLNILVQTGL